MDELLLRLKPVLNLPRNYTELTYVWLQMDWLGKLNAILWYRLHDKLLVAIHWVTDGDWLRLLWRNRLDELMLDMIACRLLVG